MSVESPKRSVRTSQARSISAPISSWSVSSPSREGFVEADEGRHSPRGSPLRTPAPGPPARGFRAYGFPCSPRPWFGRPCSAPARRQAASLILGSAFALLGDAHRFQRRRATRAAGRYALAGGCFALRSEQTGNDVARAAGAYNANAPDSDDAEPFRMQATDLGKYLFYGPAPDFMARNLLNAGRPSGHSQQRLRSDRSPRRAPRSGSTTRRDLRPRNWPPTPEAFSWTTAAGAGGPAGAVHLRHGPAAAPTTRRSRSTWTGFPPDVRPRRRRCAAPVEGHMHQMAFEFLGFEALDPAGWPWQSFRLSPRAPGLPGPRAERRSQRGARERAVDTTGHDTGGCRLRLLAQGRLRSPTSSPTTSGWSGPGGAGLRCCQPAGREPLALRGLPDQARRARLRRDGLRSGARLCGCVSSSATSTPSAAAPVRAGTGSSPSPVQARQVIDDGKLAVVMGMEICEPFGCRIFVADSRRQPATKESTPASTRSTTSACASSSRSTSSTTARRLAGDGGNHGDADERRGLALDGPPRPLLRPRTVPGPGQQRSHADGARAQRRRADRERPRGVPVRRPSGPGLRPPAALQPAREARPRRACAQPDRREGDDLRPERHERDRRATSRST